MTNKPLIGPSLGHTDEYLHTILVIYDGDQLIHRYSRIKYSYLNADEGDAQIIWDYHERQLQDSPDYTEDWKLNAIALDPNHQHLPIIIEGQVQEDRHIDQ